MSRALVINGANFSTNKVETISIVEPVPCTSISLSDSTHTFDTIGATKTLVATKIPADTTDALSWDTSDSDVATVVDGIVTCVGIGSCTITATCGEQTATCIITSEVVLTMDGTKYAPINKFYVGKNSSRDYLSMNSSDYARTYYNSENDTSGYMAISSSDYSYMFGIVIPNGTEVIEIDAPDAFSNKTRVGVINSQEQETYTLSPGNQGAKALAMFEGTPSSSNSRRITDVNITSLEDAYDACIVSIYIQTGTGVDISEITGDVYIRFKKSGS